nr:helix-turn-helix transcriptional regulator [uncultured Caproiciproducens sp.]
MIRIYLSKLLGERKLTQNDLAQKTGIRPTTIGEMYHELIQRVNVDHLDKICEALDCSIADLMEYIPKSNVDNHSFEEHLMHRENEKSNH